MKKFKTYIWLVLVIISKVHAAASGAAGAGDECVSGLEGGSSASRRLNTDVPSDGLLSMAGGTAAVRGSLKPLGDFGGLQEHLLIGLSKTDDELAAIGTTRSALIEAYEKLDSFFSLDTPIEEIERCGEYGRTISRLEDTIAKIAKNINTMISHHDLSALKSYIDSLPPEGAKVLLNTKNELKPFAIALIHENFQAAVYLLEKGAAFEITDKVPVEKIVRFLQELTKTSQGLKRLGIKAQGKLPETYAASSIDIMNRIRSLREGYGLFLDNLRKDISENVTVLSSLQDIAKYVVVQPPEGFPEIERKKAARILRDLPIAIIKNEAGAQIVVAEENMKRLSGLVGQLKTAKGKKLSTFQAEIIACCAELKTQYTAIKELTKDYPLLRRKLEIDMIILNGRGSAAVDDLLKELGMEPRESADAGAASGAGRAAKEATAIDTPAGGFDLETVQLDLEALEALLTSSKADQKAIQTRLTACLKEAKEASVKAGTKESTIGAKALKRFIEKIRHMLTYKQDKLDKGVARALDTALKRGVANQFIWDVLYYSQDEQLKAAYEAIDSLERSDKDTVVTDSVSGSLITPGGKLRSHDIDGDGSTMGGSVLGIAARDHDFDGFEGVDGIGAGGSVDFEAGDEVEEDAFKGVAIPPVNIMPLHRAHLETILKLFEHDYTNLAEDGKDSYNLFTALGDRYEVRYTAGGKAKINDLQITDTVAAATLARAGKDPKHATVTADAKHASYAFKGPKPRLAAGALKLLTNAGVTKAMVEARLPLAAAGGAGVGASAAVAVVAAGGGKKREGSNSPTNLGAASFEAMAGAGASAGDAGASATVAAAAAGGGKKRGGSNSPTNLGAASFEAMAGAGASAGDAGTGASKARDVISLARVDIAPPVHFTGVWDGSDVHLIQNETADRRIKTLFDGLLDKDLIVVARENGLMIHLWKNSVSSRGGASQNIEHYETIENDGAAAIAPTSVHLLKVGEGRYQLLKMLESSGREIF